MRFAVIDLGTNSVRFDVHQVGKKSRLLHREKLMIRLGQDVFLKGKLNRDAMDRAAQAFVHFAKVARALQVQRIIAFGTSALRESSNGKEFIERIQEESGIEIRSMSGAEEARYIATGILRNEKKLPPRFALVDIGGGSTEVSICRKKNRQSSHSFQLGTARLQQVFLKRIPPQKHSVQRLREYIRASVRSIKKQEKWPQVPMVIASSGTAKALLKLIPEKKIISRASITALVNKMEKMNPSQLLSMKGMEAKRVDMILGGTILLEEIMYELGAKSMRNTEYSLRDGIVAEEIELQKNRQRSHIELHLEDLFTFAEKFGRDREYLERLVDIASLLFNRMQSLHKLPKEWRIYLIASVILRDLGELVCLRGYEKHTYYIVKHADIPAMEPWETEFIALLCKEQADDKPAKLSGMPKERRAAFLKLLALLRIIDAIDLGPEQKLQIAKIALNKRQVILTLRSQIKGGMEALFLERKSKSFEELFKRQIFIQKG